MQFSSLQCGGIGLLETLGETAGLWSWLAENGAALGAIGGIVSVIGLVVTVFTAYGPFRHRREDKIEHQLERSAEDRQLYRQQLGAEGLFQTYQNKLRVLNAWADQKLGQRNLTLKSFHRCLLIAFAYPLSFFLLAWLFGANGRLGGEIFLRDEADFRIRLYQFWAIILMTGIIYLGARYSPKFGIWFRRKLETLLETCGWATTGMAFKAMPVVEFIAVAGAGAGAVAVAVAVAFAVAGAGAGAVAVAFAGAGAGAVAGPLILFWVVLPIGNATLDWLSVAATRYFLKNAASARPTTSGKLRIVLDLMVDLILAALCMLAMALLLPNIITGYNAIGERFGVTPIDVCLWISRAESDPFGEGLFVWSMFFTTLVPTIVHIAAGIIAFFTALKPSRSRQLAALIPSEDAIAANNGSWPSLQNQQKLASALAGRQAWRIPAVLAAFLCVGTIGSGLFVGLLHIGYLGDVARTIMLWHGSACSF